jgi:hypothetical protein
LQTKGFHFKIILILWYILSSVSYDIMNMHDKPVVIGELILLLGVVQISSRPPTRYRITVHNIRKHIQLMSNRQIIMRNNLYILVIKKNLVYQAHSNSRIKIK